MGRHSDVSIRSGREHGAMFEYDRRLALIGILPHDVDRFWEKVDVRGQDDCWEWQAYRCTGGYGTFGFAEGGRRIRANRAHRFSFAIHNLFHSAQLILHACDNPPCVNPRHLRDGSVSDNAVDSYSRGRKSGTLKPAEVREIRTLLAAGESFARVAARFEVRTASIRAIASGKTWGYIK